MVSFRVDAVPVAQPRQRTRAFQTAGGIRTQNYTPAKAPVNVFKAAVQAEAAKHFPDGPMEGPLFIQLHFILPRPKSMQWKSKPMPRVQHAKKPDIENLVKSTLDALTGFAYRDDSHVSLLITGKWVAAGNETPHVFVTASEHLSLEEYA